MEVIAIEGKTFEQIKERFEAFAKQINNGVKWIKLTVCGLIIRAYVLF